MSASSSCGAFTGRRTGAANTRVRGNTTPAATSIQVKPADAEVASQRGAAPGLAGQVSAMRRSCLLVDAAQAAGDCNPWPPAKATDQRDNQKTWRGP